jgi:trans-2,3-dihydro-3-hydroxyanthranilate isomerase
MLEFHTLDVFTTTPFSGNPLAVVLGADALSTAQMQTIAREFNLSETIFVQAPDDPKHTAKVRIFFPTAEIPFAGHPTIGCAIHLACSARIGDFTAHLVLEEVAGLVPVTVSRVAGHVVAEFTAPVLPYEVKAAVDAQMVANALDLKVGQIGFGHHHACVLQGGPRFLYVPVVDTAALAQARPVEPDWSRLMQICEVDSSYCYTPGHQSDFQARMFSPTAGIIEDPATGSASAILAAQLHKSRALTPGTNTFTLLQGIEMGRRSEIGLTIDVDPNGITSVRIKGSAVQISQGKIRIP